MKIKSIHINAFGCFHNKIIEFGDGINLIYGQNEAGKSTVHKFIEAMFYGFFKPYSKKRLYDGAYEDYLPWDYDAYGGSLVFEDGGQVIRLERQLTKGKDELKIYDQLTGEAITGTYPYNKVIRQAEPGQRHFGSGLVAYRNTVSLAQMASMTEDEMTMEIKEHLSNMTGGHGQISVDKVLKKMDRDRHLIGSERKSASPYAQIKGKMDDLKDELGKSRQVYDVIRSEQIHEYELKEELERLDHKKEGLEKDMSYIDHLLLTEKRAQLEALDLEKKELEDLLNQHHLYKEFDVAAAEKLRARGQDYKEAKAGAERASEALSVLKERVRRLESESKASDAGGELACARAYEAVCQTIGDYQEKAEERKRLEGDLKALGLEADEAGGPSSLKATVFVMVLSGFIFAGILAASVLHDSVLWWMVAVAGFLFVITWVVYKRKREEAVKHRTAMEALDHQKKSFDEGLQMLDKTLENLLKAYELASFDQLLDERDRLLSEKTLLTVRAEEEETIRRALMIDRELLADKKRLFGESKTAMEKAEFRWTEGLRTWDMASEEDIASGLQSHMAWQQAKDQLRGLEQRIETLLEGRNPDAVRLDKPAEERNVSPEDKGKIKMQLESIRKEQAAISEAISGSVSKQATLRLSSRAPVAVEEAMAEAKTELQAYDHQLAVFDLMKKTVESISVDIQNNFAPDLNASVSNMVNQITGGRYKDIKVNPDMALTVYDANLHRTLPTGNLSAGTIDAFYLALRLGVSEMLTQGKKLPLILDDPFVQYDSERLAAGMELLLHSDRQVLLFTCHRREATYMNQQKMSYNEISIGREHE